MGSPDTCCPGPEDKRNGQSRPLALRARIQESGIPVTRTGESFRITIPPPPPPFRPVVLELVKGGPARDGLAKTGRVIKKGMTFPHEGSCRKALRHPYFRPLPTC
jgi:hypothetical protein